MTLQFAIACVVTSGVGFLMIARGLFDQMLEPREHRFCAACGRKLAHGICKSCRTHG